MSENSKIEWTKECKRSHNYNGGSIASNGYKIIYVGKDHHLADVRGYAYEHRIEAEKKIGRRLLPGEIVHHLDENKLNNAHDNLQIVQDIARHRFLHRVLNDGKRIPGETNPSVLCECGCGNALLKYDRLNRPRRFISGHNIQKNGSNKN